MEKSVLGWTLFISMVLISCQNTSTTPLVSIPIDQHLMSEKIELDRMLYRPSKMVLIDQNTLLMYDNIAKGMFNIFSINSGRLITSWGDIGDGPNEFLAVKDQTITYSSGTIFFLDNNNLVTYHYRNGDSIILVNEKELVPTAEPINGFVALSDSEYIRDNSFMADPDDDYEMIKFSNVYPNIKGFGTFPDNGRTFNNKLEKVYYYMKKSTFSAVHQKLACFYVKEPIAKIFNTEGELLHKFNIITNPNNQDDTGDILYSLYATSTDNFIYVLYGGHNKDQLFDFENEVYPEIHKWNWEGEFVGRYKLDQKIGSFAVQDDTDRLFATDLNGGKFIYEYQLPIDELEIENSSPESKKFENKYYRVQIPENYQLIPGITASEINNVRKLKANMSINSNYFYIADRQESDECHCVIKISMILSDDSSRLTNFMKAGIQSTITVSDTIESISRPDSISLFLRKRQYKSTDPKGVVSTLKEATYFWYENDHKAYSISTTCENDTYCMETLDGILNSFVVK